MTKRKHVHQYHKIYPHGKPARMSNRDNGVWACALPDCTHFMPHNVAGQVVGKLSLCNKCMESFVLDDENMRDDKPICPTCANPELATPAEFDIDRYQVRSLLATQKGIPVDEVTDEMIDKWLAINAFKRG